MLKIQLWAYIKNIFRVNKYLTYSAYFVNCENKFLIYFNFTILFILISRHQKIFVVIIFITTNFNTWIIANKTHFSKINILIFFLHIFFSILVCNIIIIQTLILQISISQNTFKFLKNHNKLCTFHNNML